MSTLTIEHLTERLELADALRSGRDHMLDPQDLPGRFGRVIRAVDDSDVVELIRTNLDRIEVIRQHLATVHPQYVARFDILLAKAAEQIDE